MSRTITGAAVAVQQKTTGYKKQTGSYEIYTEDHTTEAAAIAAGQALAVNGYEWEVSPLSGGCYRMTARGESSPLGGGGTVADPNLPLNDVWELQPNVVEKDFLEADLSAINALSADMVALIKKSGDDPSYAYASDAIYTAATSPQKTTIAASVKLLRAGVKSIRVFAPVLRHTLTVSRNYTVAAALTNCGSVLSTSRLYSSEGVPNTLLFNLPTGSNPTRTDGLVPKYGWFKKYPQVTQVGQGRWQIVQEWEYGLWSTELYTYVA